EIGYENLSPWQQRYFNQIEGARDFGNAIKGSAEGLKNAVVDTAVGLWDMVVHADETIEGINFTLHHPDVTFNIIKKGIEDSYQRDVVNGDSYTQARWFSYAVGMVGTSIVGSKGVDKAAKAAKAGKVGQVAAKATKASKKVSKQALEKSVASFKKSMQRVASNIKGIQIHNPFAPQVQFAGGGKLPYNAIEGSNFKEELIRRIKELANVEKGDIGINKATSEKVVNALSNFKSRKMTFGNRRFLLDKKGMKHILERHHPKYWDGSVKATQSFFKKDLSTEDIANAIESILKQNRGVLTEKDFRGTTGKQQITGTYNGVKYVVGFKKGRIGQFYPVE
ncbi:EndoU domain-containing protein, partial [Bacillus paralicheniformis]|uniref:EndoU domain-containing protein n=10 Tax=Bacillaceae TaxID=186817 RepID=UPI001643FF49